MPAKTDRDLRRQKLVLASHNQGKLREMADLVMPHGIGVVGAAALGLPEPAETGDSFAANALIKARAAAVAAGLPALGDDSGLAVRALDGRPGIYSARWAGPDRDFSLAMARVNRALAAATDRRATFHSVLALVWPDGAEAVFAGTVAGRLVWPPRGTQGFGYDPMFVPAVPPRPEAPDLTFGELRPEEKHAISHRTVAFRKFAAACLGA